MKPAYRNRINRRASPWRTASIPIASVVLGSMTPLLPFIASAPVLPPFGLIILLCWRMLRPGLWPIWCGVPFGMLDDIFSGQPIGSAVLIWSIILISMDLIDQRYLWRNYWQDWLLAALFIIFALLGGLAINNLLLNDVDAIIVVPQIILSVFAYPLTLRLVARLDHIRLRR